MAGSRLRGVMREGKVKLLMYPMRLIWSGMQDRSVFEYLRSRVAVWFSVN